MNHTKFSTRQLAGPATVTALRVAAGCGAVGTHPAASGEGGSSTNSGGGTSSCGGVYRVHLPHGPSKLLGACAGTLHADRAPRVLVHVGDEVTVRSVTDTQGAPVEQPPVTSAGERSLKVVVLDIKHGLLVLKAIAPGHATLTAHSRVCISASGKPAASCPVLHVTVAR